MGKKPQNKKQMQKVKNNSKTIKKKQADDKSARIKKAKIIRAVLSWTILIGILVGLLIFLCNAELFAICDIEVVGNNQVPTETILQLSRIDLQDNIFLTGTIKAQNKIRENPYIQKVKVQRVLPDKIKIEVVEKQKAYILQLNEQYAYIDANGDILEISNANAENLIALQGYTTPYEEIISGKTLNEEDIERLNDLRKILKSSENIDINDKITSINIKDKNQYILYLPVYKKIVYLGDTSSLSTKMLRTKDIIDKTTDKEGKIFVNGQFNKGFDPYFREEANN